jgi:hypothetical protein
MMKFIQPRPFADPDAAARKLMEIANSVEPVPDGRIHIELINWPFLQSIKVARPSTKPVSISPSHAAGFGSTRAEPI